MKTIVALLFTATILFGADSHEKTQSVPNGTGQHGCWTDRVANDTTTGKLVAEFRLDDGETIWLTIPTDYSFDPKCFDLVEKH